MMIKKKSNPWARLKYLYVLPLAAVAVAAFARPEVSNELAEISDAKVNDLTSIVKTEEVKSVENSSDEKFKLSGTVVEAARKNVPVMGASVIIKGTTNGTLTDIDGKFVMTGVKKGDVIQVSFVGYQTQSVVVKDESPLTILMREDVHSMEEMVVTSMLPKSENADVVFEMPLEEAKKPELPQKEEVIFQVVEEMPEFPGGMQKAMEFLGKNIKYPTAAQQAKIEGRVIVQFVVGRDGSISDVHTLRGVCPDLDAEAIRVVSLMPKWKPGKQRGKAVAVKFTMPIMFRLQTPPAPEKEETGFQRITLKVGEGATNESVDWVKNHLRSRYSGSKVNVEKENSSLVYLVVVDGVEKGTGVKALRDVPVATIESMEAIGARKAVAKYGDKAKDGAILITTKKKDN